MARFHATYAVITEESADQGDYASSGFCSPGGWRHEDAAPLSLREAIEACGQSWSRRYGAGFEDVGRWFATADTDEDYRTGESTSYAIHPPATITASSYARLRRLLTGR